VANCEILNGGNAPYSFDMTQPRLEFALDRPVTRRSSRGAGLAVEKIQVFSGLISPADRFLPNACSPLSGLRKIMKAQFLLFAAGQARSYEAHVN
jgi:hypothetical protein